MKITTINISFTKKYTFEEMYTLIFSPNKNVSDLIKCFRRYRTYLIGLQYVSNTEFSFSFTFPNRETLLKFREEFARAESEIPH